MSEMINSPMPDRGPMETSYSKLWRDTFNQAFADGGTTSLAAECADEAVERYGKAMEGSDE